MKAERYAVMAGLFRYPGPALPQAVRDCRAMLHTDCPEALPDLERFAHWVEHTSLYDQEEIFTRTFHVQAICFPDLGYVIFGEDYKRGEFLVNMQREQAEAQNDCGGELPDNLVNVLTLLPLMKDYALRDELCVRIVLPALRIMLKEFDQGRLDLREKMLMRKHKAIVLQGTKDGNIYGNALSALLTLLLSEHIEVENHVNELPASQAFIHGAATCGTCSTPHHKTLKTT